MRTLKNSHGEPFVSVSYDESIQATVDIWKGEFETVENFKKGLEVVLDTIIAHRSPKWLADLSEIQGDFSFVQEYIPQQILPPAIQAGLRFEALVLPHDIFGILSVQLALPSIEHLTIKLFSSRQEAIDWLTSRP